jgi:hypothetical protein
MAVILYFTAEFYGELRPNPSIAIGGITALFISYRLVKRVNISKILSKKKKEEKVKPEIALTTEKSPSMIKKVKYYGRLIIPHLLIFIATYLILDNYEIEYTYWEDCIDTIHDCTPGYKIRYRSFRSVEEYSVAVTLISLALGNFIIPKLIQLVKKKP